MPTGAGKLTAWERQLRNRNFLSPAGFKFTTTRAPKADFFSQSATIPGINLGTAVQSNYLRDLPVPGDKLVFNDFDLTFFVDENLENYLEIERWMRGLGYPESLGEAIPLDFNAYSDGTLLIFNSNFNNTAKVDFYDMFPVSLTPISFTAQETDINYIMATATFKYTIFNVESLIEDES
jgi:hypothetical protein